MPRLHDPAAVVEDFPLITHFGPRLAFLDNAASSQKPRQVINRMSAYYEREHANIHRGLYTLSEQATRSYENARTSVAEFIGAGDVCEVIFTRGCTEAINIVARTWGEQHLTSSSEVIISVGEHHANIVPWQMLSQKIGFKLHFLPLDAHGVVDEEALEQTLNKNTALVSLFHVSNVLGTINPLERLIPMIRSLGGGGVGSEEVSVKILIDGAQGVVHIPVNVRDLGADFYTFSSHKMCGPTGLGVLWGRKELLETLPPFHGGGNMIEAVTKEGFTTADLPHRLEAGTPAIAEVLGLEAAVDYLQQWDRNSALEHERSLGLYLCEALKGFKHIRVWPEELGHQDSNRELSAEDSTSPSWVGTVSFHHEKIHAHDLALFADSKGVAVRAGHHCAMPLHQYLSVSSTLRASPYLYNTRQDIDLLIEALFEAEKLFL